MSPYHAACGVRVVCVATVGSDWCTRVYVFVSPRQYSSGLDRSRVLRRTGFPSEVYGRADVGV